VRFIHPGTLQTVSKYTYVLDDDLPALGFPMHNDFTLFCDNTGPWALILNALQHSSHRLLYLLVALCYIILVITRRHRHRLRLPLSSLHECLS
jgi:hypothetical protein